MKKILTQTEREDIAYARKIAADQDWLEELMEDAIIGDGSIEVADGCLVEPDGVCPHSHWSPLRILGLI